MTPKQKQQFMYWLTNNMYINAKTSELIVKHVDHYFAPVPANPDDEVAAVNYVTEKHNKQAGDNWYEEDESEKQAFLAGCTHKAAQQKNEIKRLRQTITEILDEYLQSINKQP